MNIDILENKVVEDIKNMEERKLLKEAEEKMLQDKEVQELIKEFQLALDDYNFGLKTFGENNSITIDFQKKLYQAKLRLDSHPLVNEYNKLLIKCNEPLRYIENNLISLFARRGEKKC